MNKFNSELFAKCLKERRAEYLLDLRDLSALINVSASTLSRIERLGTPDLATFIKLCEFLDCDAGDFITNEAKEKEKKIFEIDAAIDSLKAERDKILRS